MTDDTLDARRRRARRMGFWLVLLALAIYVGYIVMSIRKGRA